MKKNNKKKLAEMFHIAFVAPCLSMLSVLALCCEVFAVKDQRWKFFMARESIEPMPFSCIRPLACDERCVYRQYINYTYKYIEDIMESQ